MALAAGHADVRPSERELGGSVVIELGTLPLRSVMTHCAILGKSRCQVVGVLGAVVVGQVTGYARRCNAFESAIAVALCADRGKVRAGKRILGGRVVIELAAFPLRCGMADNAIPRESCSCVVGVLGVVEGCQVAGDTHRWCSGKDVVDVALIAGHGNVRAGELELGSRVVIELAALPLRGGVAN